MQQKVEQSPSLIMMSIMMMTIQMEMNEQNDRDWV